MPYAVIASENIVNVGGGRQIRGRPYRWGVAEVENEQHCDFIRLRRVLMEKYMLDLVDSTVEKHHQRYRQACMLRRIKHCQEELAKSGANGEKKAAEPALPALMSKPSLEGGLDTLVHISRYGREYLEKGRIDNDPIYRERHALLNEKYAVMIAFHDDRFEAWRTELRTKQAELNNDIERMNLK
jgi:septin family protein